MNELIKITEENGRRLVSARELYNFIEATERFSQWFERYCKYGFEENVDFTGCKVFNTLANQELQDYAMTIDMAKELSMLQRNDKGKEARKYFIECEKQLKKQASYQIEDPIERAKVWIKEQEEKKLIEAEKVKLQVELDESKEWYSIKRVSIINNVSWKKYDWRKLKKESAIQNVQIQKIFDANYGEVNLYHKSVWNAIYPNAKLN